MILCSWWALEGQVKLLQDLGAISAKYYTTCAFSVELVAMVIDEES